MVETTARQASVPPGSFGLPLIGESIGYVRDLDFMEKRQQRHGPVFKTHLFGSPTVVMIGAEANRFILSSGMEHFSAAGGWPATVRALIGHSLFLQDGAEHTQRRKLLAPAFHSQVLVHYLATMEQTLLRYLQRWEHLGTFTWMEEFKSLTFEIASILILGSEPGEDVVRLNQLFDRFNAGLFAPPVRWGWTPLGQALRAREAIRDYIERAIRVRQQTPANDALGLLVQSRDEEGNGLDMEELKDQALLLLFAGHETTTSWLTCLCMVLAQHPDILARARAEQHSLAIQGPLTMEHIRQMSYLDQVLRETERLYPPSNGGFRRVIKPFDFNGYHIPAGWAAHFCSYESHLDPTVFTEPTRFDPDRFSPERAEHKKQAFSLIGFGGGPRICIGMTFAQLEAKITASHLLRHYEWELLPNQRLTISRLATRHPTDGLKVRFRRLP